MNRDFKATKAIKEIQSFIHRIFRRDGLELTKKLASTKALEDQLTRSSKSFERNFLKVLTTLESLHDASEQLSSTSSVMLELSQGEQNPINSISRKLDPNLSFIECSAEKLVSLVSVLDANSKRIDTTLSFESQLNNTFSQLTYIRTLFAVEAAPLEQSAKVMFTSLVEEIHRLQKDVTGIFSDNFQALHKNRGTIVSLINSLQTQSKDQISIHAKNQKEVNTAVQNQVQILSQDIETNSLYKKRSDAISQSIGNAIVSLQTQDIVSQKIHHIFEVSQEMKNRYASSHEIKDKKERCSELRFIENAALVILNQISAIKSELQTADRSIDDNLRSILDAIKSMESIAPIHRTQKNNSQIEGNKGQSLILALENTGEMVGTAENFLLNAFRIIEPIRGQATNVSSTIVRLSSQLHLIGLNAEIHAAQLGGGTALETLSAKTSGISVETRELCRRISEQLDQLASALHDNVNDLESLHAEAKNAHESILQAIPQESQNLTEQNALYSNAQKTVTRLMNDLRSTARDQRTRTDFQETMIQELNAMQEVHREISKSAKKGADKLKVEVNIPEIMNALLSRYTMNSEKAVHLQTLGIHDDSFSSNKQSQFDSQNQDVNLFDFNFASDRQLETAFQLPQKASVSPSSTHTDDLGENVEFF